MSTNPISGMNSGGSPLRRRDKRRNITSSSTTTTNTTSSGTTPSDNNKPAVIITTTTTQPLFNINDLINGNAATQIISLAVRFDESRQIESILEEPLESGRLYNTNNQQFYTALKYLRDQTKPLIRLSQKRNNSSSNNKDNSQPPAQALTPIILSGIVSSIQAAQREQQQQNSNSNNNNNNNEVLISDDLISELVLSCQAMRQAALTRLRLRKKRYKIQRIVLPICSFCIFLLLYYRTLCKIRESVELLSYVRSCDVLPSYSPACRLTEAALFWKYRDYTLKLDVNNNNNHNNNNGQQHYSVLQRRYLESPFAMHTTISQFPISWNELHQGHRNKRSRILNDPPDQDDIYNLRWLGETSVNRLVRQAIEKYHPKDWRIVDIGCGVAGTLFSLLPISGGKENRLGPNLKSYFGVSASAAEIYMARKLIKYHDLDFRGSITFNQQSFDEQLIPNYYTIAIAIESLSFSRNLENTIDNIYKSLQPGGILIIVDDISYNNDYNNNNQLHEIDTSLRPSLLPHTTWISILQKRFNQTIARDLSLEYQLLLNPDLSLLQNNPTAVWGIIPLATPWERWYAASSDNNNNYVAASQRLLELQDERIQLENLIKRRQEAYTKTASLSYNMYICIK